MAAPLVDREFWRHPGVWRLPPIFPEKTETYLPTLDFVAGAVNFAVCATSLAIMYYGGVLSGESPNIPLIWIFGSTALIHSVVILDLYGFAAANNYLKSRAGIESFKHQLAIGNLGERPHEKLVRKVMATMVIPRLSGFAGSIRAVKSTHEQA